VERIAIQVCHRINQATPITETALVALALLGVEDRALTLAELRATLEPLLSYVAARSLPVTGELDLTNDADIRQALQALTQHGVVSRYDRGTEPVFSIAAERHLVAAFYRNSVVHFFVNRAIAELVLTHIDETRPSDPVAAGWDEALRIRDVLKFEFFFARKAEFDRELRAELALVDPEWEQNAPNPSMAWPGLKYAGVQLAPRVLGSFLEAYLVVADRLAAHDPEQAIDEKAFLAECLGVAHQYRLQRKLASTESISRELFATALKLAANRELVDPGAPDLGERRAAFRTEIETLVRRIGRIRAIAS
jgi:glycerol-3-phosphate O-acyltransferase